jgi:hypothetical protein
MPAVVGRIVSVATSVAGRICCVGKCVFINELTGNPVSCSAAQEPIGVNVGRRQADKNRLHRGTYVYGR